MDYRKIKTEVELKKWYFKKKSEIEGEFLKALYLHHTKFMALINKFKEKSEEITKK